MRMRQAELARAITSLVARSLVQRSIAPTTAASFSLVRQLHAGRRLADEFAAPSSSNSFNARQGRAGRSERLPNGIFVGGLDHQIVEEDLKRVFGSIGEVKAANVVFDRDTQRSKRFGFVYFANSAAVETVLSDPSIADELGATVGVSKLEDRSSSAPASRGRGEASESVFVAGFPPSMSKADVESAVSQFYPSSGVIDEVFLPLNRIERMDEESYSDEPRQNKGYGFVRFTSKNDAKEFLDKFTQAIEEGFKFDGSKFPPIANFAKARNDDRSGRQGGRGDATFSGRRGGFGGGQQDRNQSRGKGARDWINEDRGRYSSRGDEF